MTFWAEDLHPRIESLSQRPAQGALFRTTQISVSSEFRGIPQHMPAHAAGSQSKPGFCGGTRTTSELRSI